MTDSIDLLLEKLQEGTLAHEIVNLLREKPQAEWEAAIRDKLNSRVATELKRNRDVEDPVA